MKSDIFSARFKLREDGWLANCFLRKQVVRFFLFCLDHNHRKLFNLMPSAQLRISLSFWWLPKANRNFIKSDYRYDWLLPILAKISSVWPVTCHLHTRSCKWRSNSSKLVRQRRLGVACKISSSHPGWHICSNRYQWELKFRLFSPDRFNFFWPSLELMVFLTIAKLGKWSR